MVDRIYFDHEPHNPDIHGESVYFYANIRKEPDKEIDGEIISGGWSAEQVRCISKDAYIIEQQTRIEELSDAIIEIDGGDE